MASPSTYTELYDTLVALAEDDSTEFASYLPTAIGLGEDVCFRSLDLDYTSLVTGNLTSGANSLSKPTRYRFNNSFRIKVGSVWKQLIRKTEDFCRDYWVNLTTTGEPKYYSDQDINNFFIVPTPSSAYEYAIEASTRPVYLATDNQTNIFTTLAPDALLYACMVKVAEWQKDVARVAEWEAKFTDVAQAVNNEARRARMDDNTNVNNPTGGRNLLAKGSQ